MKIIRQDREAETIKVTLEVSNSLDADGELFIQIRYENNHKATTFLNERSTKALIDHLIKMHDKFTEKQDNYTIEP